MDYFNIKIEILLKQEIDDILFKILSKKELSEKELETLRKFYNSFYEKHI